LDNITAKDQFLNEHIVRDCDIPVCFGDPQEVTRKKGEEVRQGAFFGKSPRPTARALKIWAKKGTPFESAREEREENEGPNRTIARTRRGRSG